MAAKKMEFNPQTVKNSSRLCYNNLWIPILESGEIPNCSEKYQREKKNVTSFI